MANINDTVVQQLEQALYGANLIQELYRCSSMARVAFEDEQGNLWAV